jgi:hypothetical protein
MPPKTRSRQINGWGFWLAVGAVVGFVLLGAALGSYLLALLVVALPFVAIAIYAWRVPQHRTQIVSTLMFLKTAGVGLLTDEQQITQAIENEKKSRKRVPDSVSKSVRDRDKRCRFPKCLMRRESYADIHHIDQVNSNSDDPGNLILLCPNHHRRIHTLNRFPVDKAHIQQLRAWARGNYETQYQSPRYWLGESQL